ncbi:MAG: enoyl-CoA hydratase/isomerase family protein [Microbacterium sp.]|uniref:enoyl-CoA hydratase/isomerase family protein n=1 Tax=Microbacterium sp. TaxID=51671 RepID=UPI00261236E6|nr:enoyl-CoA hydratase/isomerase family protein [Microbacterium sp.]MCX6502563.1 enoyl-CoA hydratase/isomerase family protein [Microbacterium sp.]
MTEWGTTTGDAASVDGVRVRTERAVGRLTLDRPRALNALDIHMVRRLQQTLDTWRSDPDIDVVVLDGAGDRAFCAGGDVRALREQILAGGAADAAVFFRDEYALNATIAEYPVPIVALADGITMGGGIGLAGHAAVRIVTERSRLAMPETRIGFTPDVGGTWLLGRAPGRLGEYLALTGDSMDAADAVYAGFADHLIPAERLGDLREALASRADPPHVLSADRSCDPRSLGVRGPNNPAEIVLLFDETPGPSRLQAARTWIDDAFAADTVPGILARLDAREEPDAAAAAATLRALSPTALTVNLEAVRRARALPGLRAALEQEYALVDWFAHTQPDLLEGIRAQLVDKDRSPRWQPAALDDVGADVVDAAFAHVPTAPLWG